MNADKEYEGIMLGRRTDICEEIPINENQKITKVIAQVDEKNVHLEKLTIHFTSAEGAEEESTRIVQNEYTVGRKSSEEAKPQPLRQFVWDFNHKVDILGLYGFVSADGQTSSPEPQDIQKMLIHSLSFITNECPSRSLLEFERNFVEQYMHKDQTVLG